MAKLEDALDDCLAQLASGEATLDECLTRYPEHAAELRRLLSASAQLERGEAVRPSLAFKSRTRAKLLAHMQARPRRAPQSWLPSFSGCLRLAALTLAVLIIGTGAAQAALPGDALYSWKLTSEKVWRAVSPDPLEVDLAVARRRADELAKVAGDSDVEPLARQGYRQALTELGQYANPASRDAIADLLAEQKTQLDAAGIAVPELEQMISVMQSTTVAPTSLPESITTSPETTSQSPVTTESGSTPEATATAVPEEATLIPPVPTLPIPTAIPSVQLPLPKLPPMPSVTASALIPTPAP